MKVTRLYFLNPILPTPLETPSSLPSCVPSELLLNLRDSMAASSFLWMPAGCSDLLSQGPKEEAQKGHMEKYSKGGKFGVFRKRDRV